MQSFPHTVPLTVSGVRSHTILLEGENAEIGVRVQKPPYPISFDWSLNGSPFSGSDRVRVVHGTGSLAVAGADSAVEGKYALTIASPYQSVHVATTVQVICKSHDHLQCVYAANMDDYAHAHCNGMRSERIWWCVGLCSVVCLSVWGDGMVCSCITPNHPVVLQFCSWLMNLHLMYEHRFGVYL